MSKVQDSAELNCNDESEGNFSIRGLCMFGGGKKDIKLEITKSSSNFTHCWYMT